MSVQKSVGAVSGSRSAGSVNTNKSTTTGRITRSTIGYQPNSTARKERSTDDIRMESAPVTKSQVRMNFKP